MISRNGLWLGLSIVALLLVLDFFYGNFSRPLVLGQATIDVQTDPPGAVVIADTLELGVTPLKSGKVLPGEYVLRIEHPHFEPVRETIRVSRGDLISRSHSLVPAVGTIRLVSNPRGAAIRLNGELQEAVTPATLERQTAGLYDVELSLDGRKPARTQLDVRRGARSSFSADLNRLPVARLTLDLKPSDAKVELLDTPLVYETGMTLPVATYQLRISRKGYRTHEQSVEIKKRSNLVSVTLEQLLGELQVRVSPNDAKVSVRAQGDAKVRSYVQPQRLPIGKTRVTVSKAGYRTQRKTIALGEAGAQLSIDLQKFQVTPGRLFRDSLKNFSNADQAASEQLGPELVELAAASFQMGDLLGIGDPDELPAHGVSLQTPFAIGIREVSQREWALQFSGSTSAQASSKKLPDQPIAGVSYDDIQRYLRWLSNTTGEVYRLPSEAEWEYAARAGQAGRYGETDSSSELCDYANVADATLQETYDEWAVLPCDDGHLRAAPGGSFKPNAFGLFDTIGNLSEWVADCWHDNYKGAPANGQVWGQRCNAWVSRGGAWDTVADDLRLSFRTRITRKGGELGFRVVREL